MGSMDMRRDLSHEVSQHVVSIDKKPKLRKKKINTVSKLLAFNEGRVLIGREHKLEIFITQT
jgi:hypothetical protein